MFVSPSLRLPGILRTPFFSKVGGPSKTIAALESAFRDGASVTAKVLWLPKNTHIGERGRGPAEVKARWIRCTPLLGSDDRVGLWMIVLVPVDRDGIQGSGDREMIEEMQVERRIQGAVSRAASRNATSRARGSIDEDSEGWLGTNGFGSREAMGRGRGNDENQLYANYLRSSSSAKWRDELGRTRRESNVTAEA